MSMLSRMSCASTGDGPGFACVSQPPKVVSGKDLFGENPDGVLKMVSFRDSLKGSLKRKPAILEIPHVEKSP